MDIFSLVHDAENGTKYGLIKIEEENEDEKEERITVFY